MNFLIKTVVFTFTLVFMFSSVLIYSRWGKSPLKPADHTGRLVIPSAKNVNLFSAIMKFKNEVEQDLEKEWKKAGKLKIMKEAADGMKGDI